MLQTLQKQQVLQVIQVIQVIQTLQILHLKRKLPLPGSSNYSARFWVSSNVRSWRLLLLNRPCACSQISPSLSACISWAETSQPPLLALRTAILLQGSAVLYTETLP